MTDQEEYERLEREKAERAALPIDKEKDQKEFAHLEKEKKSRLAVSGYGVPRPTVLPPPRKVPEDLPPLISQWLGETK